MGFRSTLAAVALSCTATVATTAHAELQTWYLNATITSNSGTAPPRFSLGQSLYFTYVFNTSVPSLPGEDHVFLYTGQSFTLDGERSDAIGHIAAPGLMNSINFFSLETRSDGITDVRFSETEIPVTLENTVTDALVAFSNIQPSDTRNPQLTVHFADGSFVAATPFYFAPAVPEPATYGLALAGIAVVTAMQWARRSAKRPGPESRRQAVRKDC